MGEKTTYWAGRLVAALGGVVPQDPAEVLKVLGNLLRADPAEKAKFLEDAHAVWVGGGWAIRNPSPQERVILMALAEATRRLAEQHRWVRPGGQKPRIRVSQENVWQSRIRIVRKAKGEGVFRVGPNGLSDKALWAAAYRVQKGEEVVLVAPPALEGVARKVAQLIARRAAQIDGGNTPTIRTPYGEVRLLHGDRWEDPEALEPRLLAAWKILTAAEAEGFEEAEGEEEARDWAHQTRVNPALIRDLLGDEAEGVETYILEDHSLVREALRRLDEVVGDKEVDVYASPATKRQVNPWWKRFLGQVPSFGELREAWTGFLELRRKKGKSLEVWRVGKFFRYLTLLAAAEALITGARDPESAVMEAVEEALAEAKRLRRKERWDRFNPLLFLAPVIRFKVAEFRAREFGVTRISRDEARAVSRYFRLRAEGVEPEEAAHKAKLPTHLREAIEGGQGSYAVSTDYLRDYGLEPGEEPDYDTILLRAKVRELIEEVRTIWGEQGAIFVENLLSGREIPAAQTLTPGLTPSRAEEIVAHLRRELEGWAEA
jgi:hypothetical protein